MLITQTGFIAKPSKVASFLKSKKVAELKRLLEYSIEMTKNTFHQAYTREQERAIEDAQDYLDNFQCVEIAYLMLHWQTKQEKGIRNLEGQLTYINASYSEYNMFEVSYLHASLGTKKYKYADDIGLRDNEVVGYQEQWRKFGIEPTKSDYVDETLENVTVEDLETEIKQRTKN